MERSFKHIWKWGPRAIRSILKKDKLEAVTRRLADS